jgi:hypothetical protein
VETVIAPWLEAELGVFSCASTPADLEQRLPVIRVTAGGGSGGRFSQHPRVSVDVFAADDDAARTLAAQVHEALVFLNGDAGPAVVRSVRCDSLPTSRPWANDSVRRRGAEYTVSLRAA